jgi:dihydroorotate dehydrogenase electron transfer subunit
MIIEQTPVTAVERLTANIYALSFESNYLANHTKPGQFVNIKTMPGPYPLLRRPFSIAYIEGDISTIIFDVVGEGTEILSHKRAGDIIDVLGPLGKSFTLSGVGNTALLIGGGLGMAPLPILMKTLRENGIARIHTFLGARTADLIVDYKLSGVHVATDDGSKGCKGTVLDLLNTYLDTENKDDIFIYACGPNQMLGALKTMMKQRLLKGEISLECIMACGIGICQGCPVETENDSQKYKLVCKDGPVFDIHSVIVP